LAKDTLNIKGLAYTGAFGHSIGRGIAWALESRGATRLADVEEWSEAEILWIKGFGRKKLEAIKAVMAKHGLHLHPDRETPIRRPESWEKKRQESDETAVGRKNSIRIPPDCRKPSSIKRLLPSNTFAQNSRLHLPAIDQLDGLDGRDRA